MRSRSDTGSYESGGCGRVATQNRLSRLICGHWGSWALKYPAISNAVRLRGRLRFAATALPVQLMISCPASVSSHPRLRSTFQNGRTNQRLVLPCRPRRRSASLIGGDFSPTPTPRSGVCFAEPTRCKARAQRVGRVDQGSLYGAHPTGRDATAAASNV